MSSFPREKNPSQVAAEKGQVIIDGPDGVAVTMTPDAAEETARRLMKAVGEARQQVSREGGSPP
jgi:hypothetical protein